MVTTAASVEWTVVDTEVEALQLEYSWIKEFDPRFNVKYRDDKSYPWLAVTVGEEFPRVMVGRGAKQKGTRYFGPYSHAWAIRETVDLLLRVFPMRSCSNGVFKRSRPDRPALPARLHRQVRRALRRQGQRRGAPRDRRRLLRLHGRSAPTPFVKRLEREMYAASEAQDFERAARLRDDLGALSKALEKQAVVLGDGTDADVIALAEDPLEVAVQIFYVRGGRIRGQRGWVADRVEDGDTGELVEDVPAAALRRRRGRATPSRARSWCRRCRPDADDLRAAARRAARQQGRDPGAAARRQEGAAGDRRPQRRAVAGLHKTKRASDLTTRNRALEEIQEALASTRCRCGSSATTSPTCRAPRWSRSMVVFEDGLARKSEYRRFVIRGVDGQNDVASMHEVITRRFRRLIDGSRGLSGTATMAGATSGEGPLLVDPETGRARKFAYAPGLVVVDGGPPQVAAAQQALDELGIDDIPVCGLAKRLEEVWLPGEEDPVILPRSSEGLYLLQRIRDEAHRFAITHHRNRRSKSMVESVLDEVPGLGEVRRKTLLKHFGSLKKLRGGHVRRSRWCPASAPAPPRRSTTPSPSPAPPARLSAVNTATGEIQED